MGSTIGSVSRRGEPPAQGVALGYLEEPERHAATTKLGRVGAALVKLTRVTAPPPDPDPAPDLDPDPDRPRRGTDRPDDPDRPPG